MKKLVITRRIFQILFLAVFIYILWSTTYPLKGILSPEVIFKLDPLVMLMTSLAERVILPGIFYSVIMLVLTLILGRFFCGWVCPLGTLIDWAGALQKKKTLWTDRTNAILSKIKHVILTLVLGTACFGIQTAWVFDPITIAARFVSLNLIPTVTLGVDWSFKTVIQNFDLYGPVYDVYRDLRASVLGVNVYYFSHAGIIFILFFLIVAAAVFLSRFWCRVLCPLGSVYALTSIPAILERKVKACSHCGICQKGCRMGAIRDDMSYAKGECILCMDCVYDCPLKVTGFGWRFKNDGAEPQKPQRFGKISRKDFLILLFSSFAFLGFRKRRRWRRQAGQDLYAGVVRPPGALHESEFVDRCIRCGNCMKVCITNGLQPVMFESGFEGIWTPQLVSEIGYCEYNCTLCGNVCPTGAIPKLSLGEKQKAKLGLAVINRRTCIAIAEKKQCIVCEEHCPVAHKAIKFETKVVDGLNIYEPIVDADLCIGCGICQKVCPVRPIRAIRVFPQK